MNVTIYSRADSRGNTTDHAARETQTVDGNQSLPICGVRGGVLNGAPYEIEVKSADELRRKVHCRRCLALMRASTNGPYSYTRFLPEVAP